MLDIPPGLTAQDVCDALRAAGIAPAPRTRSDGRPEWICRRGRASFCLELYDVDGRTRVTFSADPSGWRWWNFPCMWLLALPRTGREIRLQRDAYFALESIGAARVCGGDFLFLDEGAAR